MFNRIAIEVFSSPASNDHQARLVVDGKDWLGSQWLGLDPPDLEHQLSMKGRIIVGRCECGALGCGDVIVDVRRTGQIVEWSGPAANRLLFEAVQYDQELRRFREDRSWETIGRRVEREVQRVFRHATTNDGFRFAWASTRIAAGMVHLCFMRKLEQRLISFEWDDAIPESALAQARLMYREQFDEGR